MKQGRKRRRAGATARAGAKAREPRVDTVHLLWDREAWQGVSVPDERSLRFQEPRVSDAIRRAWEEGVPDDLGLDAPPMVAAQAWKPWPECKMELVAVVRGSGSSSGSSGEAQAQARLDRAIAFLADVCARGGVVPPAHRFACRRDPHDDLDSVYSFAWEDEALQDSPER